MLNGLVRAVHDPITRKPCPWGLSPVRIKQTGLAAETCQNIQSEV